MKKTPFPTRPAEVVPLTTHEFTFDLDISDSPSLDAVCRRFADDANRALVWFVRFQALEALRERVDMSAWFCSGGRTVRDVREVAARFELNDRWEFDPEPFCSAVDSVVSRRSRIWPV